MVLVGGFTQSLLSLERSLDIGTVTKQLRICEVKNYKQEENPTKPSNPECFCYENSALMLESITPSLGEPKILVWVRTTQSQVYTQCYKALGGEACNENVLTKQFRE